VTSLQSEHDWICGCMEKKKSYGELHGLVRMLWGWCSICSAVTGGDEVQGMACIQCEFHTWRTTKYQLGATPARTHARTHKYTQAA